MSKLVVPEEIVKNVAELVISKCDDYRLTMSDAQIICDAFAQVQAEIPIVPTDIIHDLRRQWDTDPSIETASYDVFMGEGLLRRMYLADEPEVPEAVKDLMWTIDGDKEDHDHNNAVIEAERRGFLRGQKASGDGR